MNSTMRSHFGSSFHRPSRMRKSGESINHDAAKTIDFKSVLGFSFTIFTVF